MVRSLKILKLTLSWSLERSPWFKCDRVDCTNPDCAVDILLAVLLADGDGDDDLGDDDDGQDGDMDMKNNDNQNNCPICESIKVFCIYSGMFYS